MAYRFTPNLMFPIGNFRNITSGFGEMNIYDDKLWGKHLGVDIASPYETKIFSIGRGVVVYSKLHPGEFSEESGELLKRNWGGIVIIAHKDPQTKKNFYSIYGHLGKRYVKRGDSVEMGGLIGLVGKSMSESNGAWDEEHLHFGIYTGPFHGKVLPGYFKEESPIQTDLDDWKEPISFIKSYNPRNIHI
jgi:murein DD-endopeptidase MepM/ murein hydrolase activator NlpD